MEAIRGRMLEIKDPRHPSYVKYPLADILMRSCIHKRLSKVWICEILTIDSAEETEIS